MKRSRAEQRGDNQVDRARVLEVRIHSPPAVSQQTFGSSKDEITDRRQDEAPSRLLRRGVVKPEASRDRRCRNKTVFVPTKQAIPVARDPIIGPVAGAPRQQEKHYISRMRASNTRRSLISAAAFLFVFVGSIAVRAETLEMPSGLSLPLAFGINTRLIGSGR